MGADILHDAEVAERLPEFGAHLNPQRHCSAALHGDLLKRSSILTLFGTEDPAHVDACEDIAQDLHPSRRFVGNPAKAAGAHGASASEGNPAKAAGAHGASASERRAAAVVV